ncbi:phage integrase family protein [Thermomonospora umbrina]|uniref:Phage integrase family protein n=2 Tax=Thermomonospora umbrina TaxID=111806 RepID=A0A3D9SRR3_9ACTN|nr:phage integrase family protein [Thermomonospora umbrina]
MEAGLPPIRLHDLRHGAATFLLAAGYDMKVVQTTLRLSSITVAADTYTSLLPQLARQSAEDAAIILNADTGTTRRGATTLPDQHPPTRNGPVPQRRGIGPSHVRGARGSRHVGPPSPRHGTLRSPDMAHRRSRASGRPWGPRGGGRSTGHAGPPHGGPDRRDRAWPCRGTSRHPMGPVGPPPTTHPGTRQRAFQRPFLAVIVTPSAHGANTGTNQDETDTGRTGTSHGSSQVRGGGSPGTRTQNLRIKSPGLSSRGDSLASLVADADIDGRPRSTPDCNLNCNLRTDLASTKCGRMKTRGVRWRFYPDDRAHQMAPNPDE